MAFNPQVGWLLDRLLAYQYRPVREGAQVEEPDTDDEEDDGEIGLGNYVEMVASLSRAVALEWNRIILEELTAQG